MDTPAHTADTARQSGELLLRRAHRADGPPGSRSTLEVLPAADHPAPQSVLRLEREYALHAELDPAWAARPLELSRREGRPVLVLEDPGGEPLDRLLGAPLELGLFLRLGVGVAAALRELHTRGIVHRDLKPAHVLVDAASGRAWLTGFGIATRLRRERLPPEPPEIIAGTLPYMAPEQTGRMNRSVDSRSDLYSLGVVFYEMLTGRLPFGAAEPMEWVHCHLARRPAPPAERRPEIPAVVSEIVVKLLAKTPEERFQTAAGLERDLRRCLAAWEAERRVDEFPLGEHDTPDRLLIPEKLYGREREIETLRTAFDRVVKTGTPALVLVSGYSGVGKSAVVNELHKVLVPPRGLFAAGKFDQLARGIPYSTLAQAFQSLVRRLLTKSDAELAGWRDALRDALGSNGQLMVDLVPELALVVGEQPPVPELPPQQAQSRFQLIFRRFIGVFARPEHPLALFLDDLQWLDFATLDLLQDLLTQPDVRHLLLVGAYRDNEVDESHLLVRTLGAIRSAGTAVHEITLGPLGSGDLTQLVADALRADTERVAPLARLIHAKTAGNPFFTLQFLSALADEELIRFDHAGARWSWDLGRIRAKGYTDNVVDLVVGRLTRLPPETQHAVQQLACLGNTAPVVTLTTVLGSSEEEVHAALWEAVRQELIERRDGSYGFVHDRVQEAAYSQLPDGARPEAHLRIGRLLAAHTPAEQRQEAIFEIVNQLNAGAALITEPGERDEVAELDLLAGRRAKGSAAYAAALDYLNAGAALLGEEGWARRRDLRFALEIDRAECEFLTGVMEAADERLSMLARRATNLVERAAVAGLRVDLHTCLGRASHAVAVCLEYLRHVGVDWSPHPTDADVRQEYERLWQLVGDRAIEELLDLPRMTDPAARGTLDVLLKAQPSAMLTDANLFCLLSTHMANLSLAYGNTDTSCCAYGLLAMVASVRFGDYAAGFRFARLAVDLVDTRGLDGFKARVYVFMAVMNSWSRHVRPGRDIVARAFDAATRIGDLTYASVCCNQLNTYLLAAGDPLPEAQRAAEQGLAFARKARSGLVVDLIATQLGLIRTLRGLTPTFGSFDDEHFDERQMEHRFVHEPDLAFAACWYWIRKLQARVFAGDHAAAVDAASRAEGLLWTSIAQFETAEWHFYGALARAATTEPDAAGERRHLETIAAHHARLQAWAEHCPENFENRAALVAAEIARIEGRDGDAMRLYEQAIRSAGANGFVHNEALANEVAARFYAARGFDKIARTYLREARDGYARWGADGKVRQLEESYAHLREERRAAPPTSTIGAPVAHLDLATVLRVSQAVSGEIVLERLVETLLRTALEHAGAVRGLLIRLHGGDFRTEAEATTDGGAVAVRVHEAPLAAAELPESVLRYAARTQEIVILDDASAPNPFSRDEYIRRQRARSVLCLPLVKQGALVAVLYLENNLTPNVFTPRRIAVLKVLAAEAAMSLENGRLYRELQEREAKIRRLVDANIVGVVISNLERGQFLEANDAFLDMVGYSREDLASGRVGWSTLTPAEWEDVTAQSVAQLRATGSCDLFEKEYSRKDGSRVPVLVAAAAVGEPPSESVAFVLDLTERKHAENERERLRRLEADLAHVNRVSLLGELAASLAHEIKQPIAAAIMDASTCVRWLQRSEPDVAEAREAATRAVGDARRAGEIIDRIRSLYTRSAPRREPVDVNDIVREMVALLRHEAQQHAVSIRSALAESLPTVFADRVQLQQVLMNLMVNGIEAMGGAPGDRELVVASGRAEDGQLLLSVTDSGVGLPPEQVDRVFEAFFTTKPAGTGMGLSISRVIVEAHGGRLWASANAAGRGATFQFTLPSEAAPSAPTA